MRLRLLFLLVCHNRRETTVGCVQALLRNPDVKDENIVIFDDASTDGTREAVLAHAPGAHIVEGDGDAFWNGGLYKAWRHATEIPCDAFVWLNDDVALEPDAIERTLRCYAEALKQRPDRRFILVGSVIDQQGRPTYGGLRQEVSPWALRFKRAPAGPDMVPLDTFNGNFVVVTRQVVDLIGLNDPVFYHNLGDVDYGLRARKAGVDVWLCPGHVGRCDLNTAKANRGFGSPRLSLREQWRVVGTHHGLPFRSWLHMTRRHSGLFFPLHFLLPYRRLVLPRALLAALERRRGR
jgi:GT2 family glycosyltransferase